MSTIAATSPVGVEIVQQTPFVIVVCSLLGLLAIFGLGVGFATRHLGVAWVGTGAAVLAVGVGLYVPVQDVKATVERLEEHYGIEVAAEVDLLEDRADIIIRHPNGDLADAILMVDDRDETASIWTERPDGSLKELEATR